MFDYSTVEEVLCQVTSYILDCLKDILELDTTINATMNVLGFYTNRDWESSRGRYELVHSPKGSLLLSPSAIPFLVLLFSAGIFLGRTWINVGTLPALDGYSTNNNASLPIAWLMSFPVSMITAYAQDSMIMQTFNVNFLHS